MLDDLWWAVSVLSFYLAIALWWVIAEVDRMDEAQRWADRILTESSDELDEEK